MSKAMFALTLSVAVALASAACRPGAPFDEKTGKACPKQTSQASISTDGQGNINVNTAVNGDVRVVRREEATISIKDMIDDIAASKKTIGEMQNNAALYVAAQGFMTDLAKDTMKTTTAIQVEQANAAKDIKKVLDDLAGIEKKIDGTVDNLKKDVAKSLQEGDAKIAASVKKAEEGAAQSKKDAAAASEKSAAALKKQVDDATKPVKTMAATVKSLTDNYAKDSLYFQRQTFQLLDWKAGQGRGAGRIFYKTNYNPGAPGHYSCEGNHHQLQTACRDLSAFLKSRDGVDRALKPACDHPSHCRGTGVSLPGSYLSHYSNVNNEGYGMPHKWMTGVMMYNHPHSWHGCHMLVNYGRSNNHYWTNYGDHHHQKGRSTLCTGSNSNYKKGPK